MKDKWITRLKLKRISKYVMIFTLVFLVILSGFTLYGDKVGNFVVVLKEDKVKISACLTKNFEEDLTTRFDVPGIEYLQPTTYRDLPDTLTQDIGIKNDSKKKYMAFSFYLLNQTDRAINYDIVVHILDELPGTRDKRYLPSDALRILILEESEIDENKEGNRNLKEDGALYARAENSIDGVLSLADAEYPEGKAISFLDDSVIIKQEGIPFAENEVKKYTVVLWLEGYDISCKSELIGGRLKMKMSIEAY